MRTTFCKCVVIFIFESEQIKEARELVEEAQFKQDMKNLENWLQKVKEAEKDKGLMKRFINIFKPGVGKLDNKSKKIKKVKKVKKIKKIK